MKRASVSETKNGLSALLERVRHGQTVVIEDRGVPIARIEPITAGPRPDGRRARLERRGIVRPASAPLPDAWLAARPPQLLKGRRASDLVIEERRSGR